MQAQPFLNGARPSKRYSFSSSVIYIFWFSERRASEPAWCKRWFETASDHWLHDHQYDSNHTRSGPAKKCARVGLSIKVCALDRELTHEPLVRCIARSLSSPRKYDTRLYGGDDLILAVSADMANEGKINGLVPDRLPEAAVPVEVGALYRPASNRYLLICWQMCPSTMSQALTCSRISTCTSDRVKTSPW
ncbi:hypothetical protein NKDENANG_02620 [Candidatus Entotheonellaceae bacterium PAL068K]